MSIYPTLDVNGSLTDVEVFADAAHALENSVTIKGFSATYERKFNLGNYESLNPAIMVWVKTAIAEGEAFDLHDCKHRLRQMARTLSRARRSPPFPLRRPLRASSRPPACGPSLYLLRLG